MISLTITASFPIFRVEDNEKIRDEIGKFVVFAMLYLPKLTCQTGENYAKSR